MTTTIDTHITNMLNDIVTTHLRTAVNAYVKKLTKTHKIPTKDAMKIWDDMSPKSFNISDITAAATGTGKAAKKRSYTRKKPSKTSGYRMFSADKREEIKQNIIQEKGLDGKELFSEVARGLGAAWKALSDDEKKPYQDRADEINRQNSSEAESESEKEDMSSKQEKAKKTLKKAAVKKADVKKKQEAAIEESENEEDPRGKKAKRKVEVTTDSDDELDLSEEE